MLCVTDFIQSKITAIRRSIVVLIYSSITGAPRTVSMGFDLSKIIQSQGPKHSLSFLFRIIKISRGGSSESPPHSFDSLCPASWGLCHSTASLRTEKLFHICSKSSCWIPGCPLQGVTRIKPYYWFCFQLTSAQEWYYSTSRLWQIS